VELPGLISDGNYHYEEVNDSMEDSPAKPVVAALSPAEIIAAWSPEWVMLLATLDAQRTELLQTMVYASKLQDGSNQKYRNILESLSAHYVCAHIWKESDYLPRSAMPSGMEKSFQGKAITQHGLAVLLSENPKDVSAQNTLVRTVSIAGAYYGLFERNTLSTTKVSIRGTELLHNYMMTLALCSHKIISQLSSPPDRAGE
jgi:hypothetical protein